MGLFSLAVMTVLYATALRCTMHEITIHSISHNKQKKRLVNRRDCPAP